MSTKNKNIDLALTIIIHHLKYDETLSTKDIAEICECSSSYIEEIEKKALSKLYRRIKT